MHIRKILTTLGLCVALGGCTLDDSGPVHSVFRPEPAKSVFSDVTYVTDRAPDPTAGGGYGTKWAAQAACGRAVAVVPAAPAKDEAVWGYVAETHPEACTKDGDPFGGAVAAIAAMAKAKHCASVFVFVHGFHTGFDGAVLRAAQVAHDAQTGCAVAAFSWTSTVKLDRYTVDQERSAYAQPMLSEFLAELSESGLQVTILGHSMGARMVLSALNSLSQRREKPKTAFVSELVLAAADIGIEPGNDDFVLLLRNAAPFVRRTTVYVSGLDSVLLASQSAHGGVPRLGRAPIGTEQYAKTTGAIVDVIDAAPVPADALDHSYFSMSYEAIYDLTLALRGVSLAERLKAHAPWPATLIASDRGAVQLVTDRRPRLVSRLMLEATALLPSTNP